MKSTERWYSPRMQRHLSLTRWGWHGVPVIVFPTAGSDAEEIERHQLVGACWPLIEAGRVKIYSCDSLAGRVMLEEEGSVEHRRGCSTSSTRPCCTRWFPRSGWTPAATAGLEGEPLVQLRQRFVVLAAGEGAHEDIGESWRMADVLGAKGIPNRVDPWGPDWPHEWHTWHAMLPQYLDELAEG